MSIFERTIIRSLCAALALSGFVSTAQAVENAAIEARVSRDVEFLASDELEGRGIETAGIAKAADYIRDQFHAVGLTSGVADGTFFQRFSVSIDAKVDTKKTRLVLAGPQRAELRLELDKDFRPFAFGGDGQFDGPLVFAGYGITSDEEDKFTYDDYMGLDVAGKVVLVMRREPQQGDKESVFNGTENTIHASLVAKIKNAWAHRAAAMLLVNDPFTVSDAKDDELAAANYIGFRNPVGIPVAQITQKVADQLLASTPLKSLRQAETTIDKALKPASTSIDGRSARGEFGFERVRADLANVVGVAEGVGPMAQQTIVIGAHYDHLGYGGPGSLSGKSNEIHNGADDNASGTAALIELARRYANRTPRPTRRLVFIAFSAEERGLLGSRHYVRKDPLFPLDDTVAMINFDMVGRLHDETLTIFGTKTAKEFEPMLDAINASHKLKLKRISGGQGPSDHASFYQANVPVFHFFTGTHKDYHRPSDDVDKINVAGMVRVTAFTEALIDSLLEMPKRTQFVKVKEDDPHAGMAVGSGKMAVLGTIPDYGEEETRGLLINDVRAGTPAHKAGLKAGDVIVDIGGLPIKNARGLAFALRKFKPGKKVDITLLRGKEKKVFAVTLGARTR